MARSSAFFSLVKKNTSYVFSFDYKWEGVGQGVIFSPLQNKNSGWLGDWKQLRNLKNTDWTTVAIEFSISDTIAVDKGWEWLAETLMYDNQTGTGTAYFDNFKLEKSTALPKATALAIVAESDTVKLWPQGSSTLSLRSTPAEAAIGTIIWSSSDSSIVSVDQTDKIVAVADSGTVTVTATSDLGLSASIKVTIDEYANLLLNGDFEQGDLYWPDNANIQAGVGKDDSCGLVLDTTGDRFYKGSLAVKPGTTYSVLLKLQGTPCE